jgi:hypothetical protein
MTDTTEAPPVLLERGRYAIFETPEGGWAVARAVETCETCRDCGCGEQMAAIQVPAVVIKMASMGDAGMVRKMRALIGAKFPGTPSE